MLIPQMNYLAHFGLELSHTLPQILVLCVELCDLSLVPKSCSQTSGTIQIEGLGQRTSGMGPTV